MKFLYIVLNILFITVIVIVSRNHFTPTGKQSSGGTENVRTEKNQPTKTLKKNTARKNNILNANIAVKHNLFNPNRGDSDNSNSGTKRVSHSNNRTGQQFKLVGVYRFGKKHGAIIISSNRNRSRSSRRGKKLNPIPEKAKRFYRLGDMLNNGFILKKVDTRTVLLSKGGESITLEMEHSNPTIRESSKPKRNAKRISMHKRGSKVRYPTRGLQPLPTIIN